MTTAVILQSSYLPWKGYFDLIHDADVFVFLDTVQYTRSDWRNRNRIKTPRGSAWLTIPVRRRFGQRIDEVRVAGTSWQMDHFRTLQHHYRRAPYYPDCEPLLRDMLLDRTWDRLSELNQTFIRRLAVERLGITTRFLDAAAIPARSGRIERLLDILRAVGADTYLSGPAARPYLDPPRLAAEGIRVAFKSYAGYPEYAQSYPPFEHRVSVIDLLVHTGPSAPEYIWGRRRGIGKEAYA